MPVPATEPSPVPVLQANRCADDRYPALAGEWLVGCVADDAVNVALSLATHVVVTLTEPVRSPALGRGWLWSPGRAAGAWVLPAARRGPLAPGVEAALVPTEGVGPAALATVQDEGVQRWLAAVPYATHIDLLDLASHTWPRFDARPLPGEPVAVGYGWAAWTERAADTDDDVWIVRTQDAVPITVDGQAVSAGQPTRLAGGPGDQRGVVAAGQFVWWLDTSSDRAIRLDLADGTRASFEAETGFEAGLTLTDDGATACWEDRRLLDTPAGIDIRCSDGTVESRPGDQRWPSLGAGWLVYREGQQVLARPFTASSPSPGSP